MIHINIELLVEYEFLKEKKSRRNRKFRRSENRKLRHKYITGRCVKWGLPAPGMLHAACQQHLNLHIVWFGFWVRPLFTQPPVRRLGSSSLAEAQSLPSEPGRADTPWHWRKDWQVRAWAQVSPHVQYCCKKRERRNYFFFYKVHSLMSCVALKVVSSRKATVSEQRFATLHQRLSSV